MIEILSNIHVRTLSILVTKIRCLESFDETVLMTIILARTVGITKSLLTIIIFHKDLKPLASLFVTPITISSLFACRLAPDFVIDIEALFGK